MEICVYGMHTHHTATDADSKRTQHAFVCVWWADDYFMNGVHRVQRTKLLISLMFRSSEVTHSERQRENWRKVFLRFFHPSECFRCCCGLSHRFDTTKPREKSIFFLRVFRSKSTQKTKKLETNRTHWFEAGVFLPIRELVNLWI